MAALEKVALCFPCSCKVFLLC